MEKYNICFSLDSNYVEQFMVSVVSILKNADADDNINLYVLDGGLTLKHKQDIEKLKEIKPFEINYIQMDNNEFKNCPMLCDMNKNFDDYHVTVPTYYRFKLAEVLPYLDKILYLDCDVIVKTSLKDLFDIDISQNSILMAKDVNSETEAKRLGLDNYYNAGVMLINLDFWRKNDVQNRLFEFAENNKDIILWQDQDVINCVLNTSIKELPNKYNYQYFLYKEIDFEECKNCSILHLAGAFKPWLKPLEHFLYDEYYFYLSFTPYKDKIIEYKQKSFGKYLKNNIGYSFDNIMYVADEFELAIQSEEIYKKEDNNCICKKVFGLFKKDRE